MSTLLVIEASPQGDRSISRAITARFVRDWREAHVDGRVVVRDLVASGVPLVDAAWVAGAFTPPDTHSPASIAAMRTSDALIAEVKEADYLLIGSPMHNLMISAALKAWIDQIVRVGATVTADNQGLVLGKRAAVILASGGDFSPGSPAEQFNHATPYLRAVLGFIGLTDLSFVLAGPTRRVLGGEETREAFIGRFDRRIREILGEWDRATVD